MIPRADYIAAVLSCVGTPTVHMGRKIGKALDCVGVPWASCVALGMDMAAIPDYGAIPRQEALVEGLSMFCDRVDAAKPAHIWQVHYGRRARHVVVPVGVNESGQPIVVDAREMYRQVRRVLWEGPVFGHWRIRGVE